MTRQLPHRLAVLTTAICFVLLIVGGLVHATGSGLACPDWPLCHGQVFPRMEGGIAYEHGHRLVALTVALLTFVLAIRLFRSTGGSAEKSPHRRLAWIGLGAALLVIVQALLGAVTVLWKLPMLVKTIHLGVSVLFFSLLVLLMWRTGDRTPAPVAEGARRFLGIAIVATYLQILLGALVRHTGSSLACQDWVLCDGQAWPDFGPAQLHMVHRYGAIVVAILAIASSVKVALSLKANGQKKGLLRVLCSLPHGLVLLQILLGLLSVRTALHVHVVTTHLAVGVLFFACLLSLYLLTAPQGVAQDASGSSKAVGAPSERIGVGNKGVSGEITMAKV